jgi:oligopeptidase A
MNVLLTPPAIPEFASLRPEDVPSAIDTLLAESRAQVAALAQQASPTWASLAAPLEAIDDRLNAAWSPVSQLNAVVNSEAWREAYNSC